MTGGSVELPRQALIGLVTPTGSEPDHVLALLAGAENPESGRVQLDGLDVPVLTATQLNRNNEADNRCPGTTDVRESSGDVVFGELAVLPAEASTVVEPQ